MAHIGIDARLAHYRVGGISTYIRQLIHALQARETRHRITAFDSRRAKQSIANRFTSKKLWTPPHHRFERALLSFELARYGLDVLHSTDFIPPRHGAKKFVITVHDLTFLHFPHHKDREAQRYYNDQIQWAVRKADHILSVSQATRNDLIEMLYVPEEKITVQPHGVDERFRPLARQNLHALSSEHNVTLPENGFILFVGTLEPRKNILTLLDAYEALYEAYEATPPLLLVGQIGWLVDDILKRIQQMQQRGHQIEIRQDISDAALPLVYNRASVFVLPSWYEGFGLPALEAMACGIPVVVSNTSSLPEIVGDAALMVDPSDNKALADALHRALTDSAWRQQAVETGLKRAGQFTWRKSAEIALSVYEQV